MSNFDGELIISYDHKASRQLGGDYWRVRKSFRFYLPSSYLATDCVAINKSRWVFVPAGMLTDLGSVPPLFRGAINQAGAASQAYVMHDQLCEYLSVTNDGRPELITRRECDLILLAGLRDLGTDVTLAHLIYNAVAVYGKVMNIREPSTSALKRQLEADYNYEEFR